MSGVAWKANEPPQGGGGSTPPRSAILESSPEWFPAPFAKRLAPKGVRFDSGILRHFGGIFGGMFLKKAVFPTWENRGYQETRRYFRSFLFTSERLLLFYSDHGGAMKTTYAKKTLKLQEVQSDQISLSSAADKSKTVKLTLQVKIKKHWITRGKSWFQWNAWTRELYFYVEGKPLGHIQPKVLARIEKKAQLVVDKNENPPKGVYWGVGEGRDRINFKTLKALARFAAACREALANEPSIGNGMITAAK